MFELSRTFRFEAAHRLPNLPASHKCSRLHGHSFQCEVVVRGPLAADTGWVIDFGDIKQVVQPTIDRLDHYYLNDIEGLENPTAEILSAWIWCKLATDLPGLVAVTIRETCTSACTYRGPNPTLCP